MNFSRFESGTCHVGYLLAPDSNNSNKDVTNGKVFLAEIPNQGPELKRGVPAL